ncbi:MAG TPA: IS110 family transposase [Terriglobales bacterium]|nr:IS110 family transposase [Terriglobales bacterium]
MLIIGCDYHPGFQQVAIFDEQTGEIVQRRLAHPQEAMEFYRGLPAGVLVGIESTGFSGWFERWVERLGHQVWIGDATQIRAAMTPKQKTDKRDGEHIVKLLVEGRFPRIWVPSAADRDARQLLVHRHKLVQWQTQVKNQLQFLALNQGLQLKWRLWTRSGRQKLEALPLAPYAGQGRATWLGLLDQLEPQIAQLDTAVLREAEARPEAVGLMTHPGVGPVISLAFVVTLGPAERFAGARQVASYFGLIPRERSSGGKQRLGGISKEGNSFMRYLLVQGGHSAARLDPELRRFYGHCKHTHAHAGVAKVAVARKLAVRLYCMLREGISYAELRHRRRSRAGEPESCCGRN